jgi:hypothetical protein
MYSEHLNNVHPGWVVGGWLVAVAVTSAVFLVLVGLGVVSPGAGGGGAFAGVAVLVGFFVGGLFVGLRWTDAPILHGAAITLLSVLVLFLLDLAFPEPLGGPVLELNDTVLVLGVILLQFVAAVGGGWLGRRWVLKGGGAPGIS